MGESGDGRRFSIRVQNIKKNSVFSAYSVVKAG